jgi:hypothetical protein
MAQLIYEVICGVTGKLITDGSQQPRIHYFSKNKGKATTTWLHLDKDEPQVAELMRAKKEIEDKLWALHNTSPTAFVNQNRTEATPVAKEVVAEVTEEVTEVMEEVAPY